MPRYFDGDAHAGGAQGKQPQQGDQEAARLRAEVERLRAENRRLTGETVELRGQIDEQGERLLALRAQAGQQPAQDRPEGA